MAKVLCDKCKAEIAPKEEKKERPRWSVVWSEEGWAYNDELRAVLKALKTHKSYAGKTSFAEARMAMCIHDGPIEFIRLNFNAPGAISIQFKDDEYSTRIEPNDAFMYSCVPGRNEKDVLVVVDEYIRRYYEEAAKRTQRLKV